MLLAGGCIIIHGGADVRKELLGKVCRTQVALLVSKGSLQVLAYLNPFYLKKKLQSSICFCSGDLSYGLNTLGTLCLWQCLMYSWFALTPITS